MTQVPSSKKSIPVCQDCGHYTCTDCGVGFASVEDYMRHRTDIHAHDREGAGAPA